jgi:hypothetical protein
MESPIAVLMEYVPTLLALSWISAVGLLCLGAPSERDPLRNSSVLSLGLASPSMMRSCSQLHRAGVSIASTMGRARKGYDA